LIEYFRLEKNPRKGTALKQTNTSLYKQRQRRRELEAEVDMRN